MILTRDGKEIIVIYRQDGSEVEEVKDATGRIVYSASREITGTLPLYFSSHGKPLTDYLISGNTLQDGTPTPEAPVDVVGCGVRTGNLFDYKTAYAQYLSGDDIFLLPDQMVNLKQYFKASEVGKTITISVFAKAVTSTRVFLEAIVGGKKIDSNSVLKGNSGTITVTVTPTITSDFFNLSYGDGGYRNTFNKFMLNEGPAPLPYEPYGYKLPLTCGDTEYPIYLGQVESTRRVKKLVLTGEEFWMLYNGNYYSDVTDRYSLQNMPCRCTHTAGGIVIDNGSVRLKVFASRFTTVASNFEEWKSYLAAQYAAGTPVTVWYVLAEPETGIINEPLMKIGDYTDTISFAQAGVIIPTVSGSNVLDTTSAVKPSAVSVAGNIKPTGYGQLFDVNDVDIQDSTGEPVYIQG